MQQLSLSYSSVGFLWSSLNPFSRKRYVASSIADLKQTIWGHKINIPPKGIYIYLENPVYAQPSHETLDGYFRDTESTQISREIFAFDKVAKKSGIRTVLLEDQLGEGNGLIVLAYQKDIHRLGIGYSDIPHIKNFSLITYEPRSQRFLATIIHEMEEKEEEIISRAQKVPLKHK